MNKCFNTETEYICPKHYCVYCGKEAIQYHEQDYHHGIDNYFYHCDCETAQDELKFKKETQELKWKYSHVKPNTKILNELKYKFELDKLKQKFQQ